MSTAPDLMPTRDRPRSAPEPPSSPRDGRQRALRAARQLFSARGFAGVSMQEIAAASDLRKASIYHHFRDKKQLFTEVMLVEMRELRRALEAVAVEDRPLAEQLERIGRVQLDRLQGDVEQLVRDYHEHVPEPEQGEIHSELNLLNDLFTGVFRRALARGEMRAVAPEIASLVYFHSVMAWYIHRAEFASMRDLDSASSARLLTDLLLHGIARG